MPRRAALAIAGLAVAVLASVASPQAARSLAATDSTPSPLTTGFVDTDVFNSPNPLVRDTWLGEAKNSGAGIIRINALWGSLAPTQPKSPTDPADPAYHMASLDATVKSARARGLEVFLTVYHAPAWAEGAGRPADAPAGSWKPDPKAFGEFGQMLATRYSGTYDGLPRVHYFEAWNEPNLSVYLTPQLEGGVPYSPTRYRELLNAFYAGVHLGQPDAEVMGGATAPAGDDDPTNPKIPGIPRLHPMIFLRDLFCLDDSLRPLNCSDTPKLDILSAHAINVIVAPAAPASNPDDVWIADFHKLSSLLEAAEAAGHVDPAGTHPIWATEFWWITNPPNPIGVSLETQARWVEQGLYLLWKQGVSTVVNWTIRDTQFDPNQPLGPQATSGLFLYDGTKKPAYDAWRFPFVAERGSEPDTQIWGKAPEAGQLSVQLKRPSGWETIGQLSVQSGQVFTASLPVTGEADLRATVGGSVSLPWHLKDSTPPETTIDRGPSGATNDPTPTFAFHSDDPNATFECRLDRGAFAPCSSPKTLGHQSDGWHNFLVRAIDEAGNVDPTLASRSFVVRTATVKVIGSTLTVVAAPGARDNLEVTRPSPATIRVTDLPRRWYPGSGIHTGAGCTRVGDYAAECPAAAISAVRVFSGDRGDRVLNSTRLDATLNGGAGQDLLVGGAGSDTIVGGPQADMMRGMNGSDTLLARDLGSDQRINCDGGRASRHRRQGGCRPAPQRSGARGTGLREDYPALRPLPGGRRLPPPWTSP